MGLPFTNNAAGTCPTVQPIAHWLAEAMRANGPAAASSVRVGACPATDDAAVFRARLQALAHFAESVASVARQVADGAFETESDADRFSHCTDVYTRMSRQADSAARAAAQARACADEAARAARAAALTPALTYASYAAEAAIAAARSAVLAARIAPLTPRERESALSRIWAWGGGLLGGA